MNVDEIRRRAELLAAIAAQADDDNPDEPTECVERIRQLLAGYDRGGEAAPMWPGTDWRPGCPPWCVEHYSGTDNAGRPARNHSSPPLAVTAESAVRDDIPMLVSVWAELREGWEGRHPVGVIEKLAEDVELSHCELRAFARHLLRVAGWVEAIEGATS